MFIWRTVKPIFDNESGDYTHMMGPVPLKACAAKGSRVLSGTLHGEPVRPRIVIATVWAYEEVEVCVDSPTEAAGCAIFAVVRGSP